MLRLRSARMAAVLFELGSCAACSAPASTAAPAIVPFGDAYRLQADVTLPDTGVGAVASVHSVDIGPDGQMLIADERNSSVTVLDSNGRARAVLGRAGSGPGEFRKPWDARFLPSGGVVVVDIELARVSVFDSRLAYRTSFPTPGQSPRDVSAVNDSTIVVAGLLDVGRRNHLLATYRLDGTFVRSFLRCDSLVFKTDMIVDGTWLTVARGNLLAGLAILPTIYRLSLDGDSLGAATTPPPAWKQLQPQEHPSLDFAVLRRWIYGATLSGPAFGRPDGSVMVSVQGTSGDSTFYSLDVYSPALALSKMYTGVPGRPVAAAAGLVYLLTETADGHTHVARYRAAGTRTRS